ncbi:1,2-phenylacetyl-CoA epoxidase subunit PaaC [Roseivirga pacifica]|uniref:1,2-phenylacetyl-CoA epoxidase subunit PaaC n=1 Tax=Roseivirga pacifica TaxID=1267423 RepID=UPI002095E4C8|nr:1,2-phenylacetyl-CoA epoxidase subunit PaaC [Roseivirga pacifica]MCO6357802.1 phenylacetate-CoA oxygenase subunit PaaC [Roseivirga pacifica]MCO6366054.1 phenylacetate-CoA oxygenase subunit PaaC [Roseivirga pacifica]MCO6371382.1 phenylacetate-CoA oxygenase subunit PaaC [Roseivirga pacifica]MCO6375446.1 phenylacetate-CoA oxygenase subunit PaaC [Roseivirga pacifica]MCO6378760.1 phenylacetate-CoA oxygenase subunit PaaC [Roseivirga pacifica]
MTDQNKFDYILQQADNCLILGQRLAEWCGHGPILEQDIALTNISLDLIGQARLFYQYAAEIQGEEKTEDDLAYLRDAWGFKNVLLVEQPNGDFGFTIMRQFLYDTFSCYFYEALMNSSDERLASIAAKSHKETLYHMKWSADWVIRLGDGTVESHNRVQQALNELWSYKDEIVIETSADSDALAAGYGVSLAELKEKRDAKITAVLEEATLSIPEGTYSHKGGKEGVHSEHLGYILADLQFLQRAYPGNEW